jgi:hypothetical protein
VYVDDIVLGGLSNSLVARFADDMSREFEISLMGELEFYLGLQINQSKEGTFVHQAKYTKDIVRKFEMEDSKAMEMPMSTTTALDADEEGEHVDQKEYRSMIGPLLYMTATRPDIQFSVCLCAHFQVSPRTSNRQAVKCIFKYLRQTPDFCLWYCVSSSLALPTNSRVLLNRSRAGGQQSLVVGRTARAKGTCACMHLYSSRNRSAPVRVPAAASIRPALEHPIRNSPQER